MRQSRYQKIPESSGLSFTTKCSKKAGCKVSRWRDASIPRRVGMGFWPLVRRLAWNFETLGISSAWDLGGMHPGKQAFRTAD